MTFHFTREAFMFITGLVLFYTYYDREFSAFAFWKKRLLLIAVPYVVWTALYIAFEGTYMTKFHWTSSYLLHTFGKSLLTANQFFLYFLLVSMQLYVVFPILIKFMRKVPRAHAWIFGISFVLEIGIMILNQAVLQFVDVYHLPTWLGILVHYRDRFILTYQFWFISGAILAIRYQQIKAWVLTRVRMVGTALIIGIIVLWGFYFLNLYGFGLSGTRSIDTLQPIMIPYSFVTAAFLWVMGMRWVSASAAGDKLRVFSRFVRFFGGVSFGIFLIHPIALHFVEKLNSMIHAPLAIHFVLIPVWVVLAYTASGCAAYGIGKIPYVSYIVGEKTKISRRPKVGLSKAM